jgi:hypothetical protein
MNYTKQMQQIVQEYRGSDQSWPATAREIAAWAISQGKWEMPATAVLHKCSQDIANAMSELYFTDESGRRVRALHPATINRQGVLCTEWDDLRTAPRKHMVLSFQQHRRKIVGECRELDTSRMSWNDLHLTDDPIQISFDFTADLAELGGGEEKPPNDVSSAIELARPN